MTDNEMKCDWCGENIPAMRAPKGQMVRERVVFFGLAKGDPRVTTHVRCAKGPHSAGARVDKYILASSADYPTRPDCFPAERAVKIQFTAEQWSRMQDCASWHGMPTEEYLAYCAARGVVDPGRRWSLENDRRVTPADKAKAVAIPLELDSADERGRAARAMKQIIREAKTPTPMTTTTNHVGEDMEK